MENISKYYEREKNCHFTMLTLTTFIGLFVLPVGGEVLGISFFQPTSVTLFECMKFWCSIQIIINSLPEPWQAVVKWPPLACQHTTPLILGVNNNEHLHAWGRAEINLK